VNWLGKLLEWAPRIADVGIVIAEKVRERRKRKRLAELERILRAARAAADAAKGKP
jgi:hypothetical protein